MKDFDITGAARAAEEELIAVRRELHRIPEYGDTLPLTRAIRGKKNRGERNEAPDR